MRWNDIANWDDTLVWDDTDTLYYPALAETDQPVKVLPQVDRERIIKSYVKSEKMVAVAATADADFADTLPSDIYVDKIIIKNTGGAGQVSLGYTSGGVEIAEAMAIGATGVTVISAGVYVETVTTLSVNDNGSGDSWGAMDLTIHLLFWKL